MDPFGYDDFASTFTQASLDTLTSYFADIKAAVRGRAAGFFGDSHLRTVICQVQDPYKKYKITPHIAYMPGATLLGFGRRTSSKQHFEKINHYLCSLNPSAIILKFGQVDMDLGYYYKHISGKQTLGINQYAAQIIVDYKKALAELIAVHRKTKFFVLPINYPTLKDDDLCLKYTCRVITENIDDERIVDTYIEKLRGVIPEYEQRFMAAKAFNAMLHSALEDTCEVISLDAYFLNSNGVKERFISDTDHHYAVTLQDKINCTFIILNKVCSHF